MEAAGLEDAAGGLEALEAELDATGVDGRGRGFNLAWQDWLKHQTLLINEKRLNLMDPSTHTFLQGEFDKFIAGEEYEKAEGYVPPKP